MTRVILRSKLHQELDHLLRSGGSLGTLATLHSRPRPLFLHPWIICLCLLIIYGEKYIATEPFAFIPEKSLKSPYKQFHYLCSCWLVGLAYSFFSVFKLISNSSKQKVIQVKGSYFCVIK